MAERTTWEDLLGGDSALLVRLGQLVFVWAKDTSVIKVIRAEQLQADSAEDQLAKEMKVALEIEVPPDLPQDSDAFIAFCREFIGADDTIGLSEADVKLLTGDLSDYDGNAERAMEGMLALDGRMREWLAGRGGEV